MVHPFSTIRLCFPQWSTNITCHVRENATQNVVPIPPWPTAVRCLLCLDHLPDSPAPNVLDPTRHDLSTVSQSTRPVDRGALHFLLGSDLTTGFSIGPLLGSPSDNNEPEPHGCGAIAENDFIVLSPPQEPQATQDLTNMPSDPTVSINDLVTPPMIPLKSSATEPPTLPGEQYNDDGIVHTSVSESASQLVRSQSRSALCMLWHQRLGYLNFRRLSTIHRFVKGMPEFTLPTALEECPVCLAAKLRKQPSGTATTMRSTVCNQGNSIDFGFMVQRSHDKKRQHNLIGLNGETCYALITDQHFSGRLYGRAFASKAPPVDWINNWLANNAPACPDKYVRMDGGGELGKSHDVLALSQTSVTLWS